MAARAGVSLASALKSYRIGHAVAWDAWLEALEELDEASRRACVRELTRFVVAYDDLRLDLFTAEYERARERELRTGSRLRQVRTLVEGRSDDATGLDYELSHEHVAVVASGPGAGSAVLALASRMGRAVLSVAVSEQLVWAWFGGPGPFGVDEAAQADSFEAPAGCLLALGDPWPGLDGFRRSHRQAGEAHLVARRRPRPVTRYAEVAAEAMALADERIAGDFVASQLGPLDADPARGRELRQTLRRYFASSQNAAATAAALGVHEQTVARRLRAIEARLGQPLNERRLELELALRLEALLNRDSGESA